MDYYDKIIKDINSTKLDQNVNTTLSNQIIDANNAIYNDDSMGLPKTEEIETEHKIGNKILCFLNFVKAGQHMDNITVDEAKVILNAVQSVDNTHLYFANCFNLDKHDTFFDLFFSFCDSFKNVNKKYTTCASYSTPSVIALITSLIFKYYTSMHKIKKSCNNTNVIYYKYIRKYLFDFDNIFNTYLQDLHLIDKNYHFSINKIRHLDNNHLVYNYCKYHCTSLIKPERFAQVIHIMFSSFKEIKGEQIIPANMIGIYLGYNLLIQDKSYCLVDDFRDKDNKVYSIVLSEICALLIQLNLFADYVTQSAFRPNKVADQAINKITMCKPYDDKIWKIFAKAISTAKDTHQKKGDSKNA